MSRRDWKRLRAHSLVHALRLCKEFAQERHNLSVERIADRMGAFTAIAPSRWWAVKPWPCSTAPPVPPCMPGRRFQGWS